MSAKDFDPVAWLNAYRAAMPHSQRGPLHPLSEETKEIVALAAEAAKQQARKDAEKLLPRPMSSAPKDQDGVLAYCPTFYQGRGGWVAAVWFSGGWHANPAGWLFAPTHWVPLPEKPVAQAIENEAGL